jgi:hypothetical protein
MDKNLLAAMQGTLKSPAIDYKNTPKVKFLNNTPASYYIYVVSQNGIPTYSTAGGYENNMVAASQYAPLMVPLPDQAYIVLREVYTGAYACVLFLDSRNNPDNTYTVDFDMIPAPGEIGPVPIPNVNRIAPSDSPRVMVGCGLVDDGASVIRTQHWHATGASYCLPPGDTFTYGVTSTAGFQSTSSDQSTTSSALNVSASAGWGPVSTSISKSMSQTSSVSHTYSIEESTSRFETMTLTNKTETVALYYAWQMIDILDVINHGNTTASLSSSRMPLIYDGPYNPQKLPPDPAAGAVITAEERMQLHAYRATEKEGRGAPRVEG